MDDDTLPLDLVAPKRVRPRTGAARAALERTLRAWSESGHLIGAASTSARRVLRDGADAVDAAHGALERPACQVCGALVKDAYRGSPGGLAYANNLYAQLLTGATPAHDGAPTDPYAEVPDDADITAAIAAALTPRQPDPEALDPAPSHDD